MTKKSLILGLGLTGCSFARYLEGEEGLEAYDDRIEKLKDQPEIQELVSKGLILNPAPSAEYDCVYLSPGVHPDHPLLQGAGEKIADVELALRRVQNPLIGITGTNGKTTVTELTAFVLQRSGRAARAVGNNGTPILDWARNPGGEVGVVELSSYMLEWTETPALEGGVILEITPDHLDRYASFEAYRAAKLRIRSILKPGAPLYVHESQIVEGAEPFQQFAEDLGLKRPFTFVEENLMAAYSLCRLYGVNAKEFLKAAEAFQKPPHRLEFVVEKEGVSYFNDSKATNIESTLRAVEVVPSPIVLIAGGQHKGSSYLPWLEAFKGKVQALCLLGEAAPIIQKELGEAFETHCFEDLKSATEFAQSIAKSGGSVLLSPGCASFDQFENFQKRGEMFKGLLRSG